MRHNDVWIKSRALFFKLSSVVNLLVRRLGVGCIKMDIGMEKCLWKMLDNNSSNQNICRTDETQEECEFFQTLFQFKKSSMYT